MDIFDCATIVTCKCDWMLRYHFFHPGVCNEVTLYKQNLGNFKASRKGTFNCTNKNDIHGN